MGGREEEAEGRWRERRVGGKGGEPQGVRQALALHGTWQRERERALALSYHLPYPNLKADIS